MGICGDASVGKPPGNLTFILLRRQEALLRRLVPVKEVISILDTHVVNTVHPSLPEITYQNISLLI